MPLYRITVRVKDEDSGTNDSWSFKKAFATPEMARRAGHEDAAPTKDLLPNARISVSVSEV